METFEFRAMGSRIQILLDADEELAWPLFAEVPVWFEGWEQCLSRFRDDSELSYINNHPGEQIKVSPVFRDVLQLALEMERSSNGFVTPAVLPALEAMGYDRSFDQMHPTQQAHHDMPSGMSYSTQTLQWDPVSRKIILPEDMRLDFGGSAKGWAAHQAAQKLGSSAPALVNAGGDIAISAPLTDGSAWQIGIQNPWDENDLGQFQIQHGGVATSGSDYRRWQQGDQLRHHLIDPRIGQSANSDLLQVTILAPDVMQAEMAAKTVFLLGKDEGLAWLENRPYFGAILAKTDGSLLKTEGLQVDFYEEAIA